MADATTAGFELSPQQRHLWNLSEGQPGVASITARIEAEVAPDAMERALHQLARRHEILRTRFVRNAGMRYPFQVVEEQPEVVLTTASVASSESATLVAALGEPKLPAAYGLHAALVHGTGCAVVRLHLPALCADASSLCQLLLDLRTLGSGGSLDDPLQYADFAAWQNELLISTEDEATAGRKHWEQLGVEAIPPLRLPYRAEASGKPGAVVTASVPVSSDVLQRLAGDDLPRTLRCAWQLLAAKLTGRDECVLSEISSGRQLDELAHAVGLLERDLPRTLSFPTDTPFAALCSRLAEESLASDANENYLEPGRLLQPIGFRVLETALPEGANAAHWSILEVAAAPYGFEVELVCLHQPNGWGLRLDYQPARFHPEDVARFARQFATLLTSLANSPASTAEELQALSAEERAIVLQARPPVPYPREQTVTALFEEQAARTPERIAVRCGETAWTYAELQQRANQLAHALRGRGVAASTPVGVCVERSVEMILAVLGVLKAGGCYVPLVTDSPKERLAHQLAETQAPVVVTTSTLAARLPEFAGTVLLLDSTTDQPDQPAGSTANPAPIATSDDLVYIIYTSGSTGTPKGVAVRHRNLVNYTLAIQRILRLSEAPEGLSFATVSTIAADLGNTSIFPALLSGGTLHVVEEETSLAANLYAAYAARYPIDVLKITPSHLAALLQTDNAAKVLPRRVLLLGGEASSWQLVDRVRALSTCRVLNHYGPTETTVGCCTLDLEASDVRRWSPATVPVGHGIDNVQVYVLDAAQQPVCLGAPGEICVGGDGVAAGYYHQPEQTEARFVPDTLGAQPNGRMYRTGDLGRMLPDGNIEFLGRIDQQVKIRGYRVEPAEIESVLRQYPGIDQVVVVPYTDGQCELRLAGYYTAQARVAVDTLRSFASDKLPSYMVPSALLQIEAIPLTRNGKLDKSQLPDPKEASAVATRSFVAPGNATEETLVTIWQEVLKLQRISVEDNFFELGGHSLLATQIISRIRNRFSVQMPLHSFLESPTIRDLAVKVGECPTIESEEEELARLLAELEGMTEEEAERLLAAENEQGESSGN
ncbi:MAG: amino acid adenylation domain-containing protein [Acidobacteriota bacterium]|nr:amino acid adenylation domain-containing protein [Acidobacteriota bacterium]